MAEYIREFKIKLYVDTNKQTIEKEFDSIDALNEYLLDSRLLQFRALDRG